MCMWVHVGKVVPCSSYSEGPFTYKVHDKRELNIEVWTAAVEIYRILRPHSALQETADSVAAWCHEVTLLCVETEDIPTSTTASDTTSITSTHEMWVCTTETKQ
ncbi:unnamed protein product [Pleuronectes platessa]|uniref:Uncharacterized protein n=1 Tax=Pleuronectes platessa TaxID=8262 RepID=A0A9N7YKT6_PLEPL|nr:unnamed protein product [Pleuronectes platessa]